AAAAGLAGLGSSASGVTDGAGAGGVAGGAASGLGSGLAPVATGTGTGAGIGTATVRVDRRGPTSARMPNPSARRPTPAMNMARRRAVRRGGATAGVCTVGTNGAGAAAAGAPGPPDGEGGGVLDDDAVARRIGGEAPDRPHRTRRPAPSARPTGG